MPFLDPSFFDKLKAVKTPFKNGVLTAFSGSRYNFQHTHFIMEGFTLQSQNRANVMPVICLFRSPEKIAPKDLSCLGKYSPKGLTKAIQSLLFACENRYGS